jgi:hypothetical protein
MTATADPIEIRRAQKTSVIRFPDRTTGSTGRPIEIHLQDEDGYAVDLSTVDHVQIKAKLCNSDTILIDKEMTISDATNGVVSYSLTTAEAANVGLIEFQFWVYHTASESSAEAFPDGDSVYMMIKDF